MPVVSEFLNSLDFDAKLDLFTQGVAGMGLLVNVILEIISSVFGSEAATFAIFIWRLFHWHIRELGKPKCPLGPELLIQSSYISVRDISFKEGNTDVC